MIDTNLHTNYPFEGAYDCDHRNYNPGKPKIKHILWKHYDTVVKWDSTGKARPCVLDNIQKSLLCNTVYLGYLNVLFVTITISSIITAIPDSVLPVELKTKKF